MKKLYDEPKIIIIRFLDTKNVRIIKNCTGINTKRGCLVFQYLASDNKIRRHYFNKKIIEYKEITQEMYDLYKKTTKK